MPEPVKTLNRKRGRKKKRTERERLSPSDALLVSTYGEDIDIASVKSALLWLADIERPGLTGERALKLLQQAEDSYREPISKRNSFALFKVWPEDQPTFHEVKDTLLKAGLKVEDKSLRRACKRVGLDLKPSRGWRGPSGTTGVYPPTRLPLRYGDRIWNPK